MGDATSAVVGLIPLTIATGVAVRTQKSLLKEKKKGTKRKLHKRVSKKHVKRVTKSRAKAKRDIDRWMG